MATGVGAVMRRVLPPSSFSQPGRSSVGEPSSTATLRLPDEDGYHQHGSGRTRGSGQGGLNTMGTTTYTDYVSSLTDGRTPDSAAVEAVLGLLRRDLIRQLARRGLLHAPPSFLGKGGASWQNGDGLDDMVHDAYVFIFLDRLESLRLQLLVCDEIDGFVVKNLRHLLSGLQRKADPIGYRVFFLLRKAVRAAVGARALHVLAGDERISNDTVLGFAPDTDPEQPAADFDDHVRTWNDDLLPDLMTARSRAVTGVVERLTAWVLGLRDAAVEVFRFKDLINPMKDDVRRRWKAVWKETLELGVEYVEEDGQVIEVPTLVDWPRDHDDPRELERIVDCVSTKVDRMPEEKTRERKTKEYVFNLWKLVRGTALTEDPPADGRKRPSDVRLGEQLGIPRHRLPNLFAELRRLWQACRSEGEEGRSEAGSAVIEEGGRRPTRTARSPSERKEAS